jgi:hypothetical protein
MTGKKVVVFVGKNTYCGKFLRVSGTTVTLTDAREVLYWPGVWSNFDLASRGPNPLFGCHVSAPVEEVLLFDVTQVIQLSKDVAGVLEGISPPDYPVPTPAPEPENAKS